MKYQRSTHFNIPYKNFQKYYLTLNVHFHLPYNVDIVPINNTIHINFTNSTILGNKQTHNT